MNGKIIGILVMTLLMATIPLTNMTQQASAFMGNYDWENKDYFDYIDRYPGYECNVPDNGNFEAEPGDFIYMKFQYRWKEDEVTWNWPEHTAMYIGDFYIYDKLYHNVFIESSGGKDFSGGNPIKLAVYTEYRDICREIKWCKPDVSDTTRNAAVDWALWLYEHDNTNHIGHQPFLSEPEKSLFDYYGDPLNDISAQLYCGELVWCAYMQCNDVTMGGDSSAVPINLDRDDTGLDESEWGNDYIPPWHWCPAIVFGDLHLNPDLEDTLIVSGEIYLDLDGDGRD